MDKQIVLAASIQHAEQQRKIRLRRRNSLGNIRRRIDGFKLLSSSQLQCRRSGDKNPSHFIQNTLKHERIEQVNVNDECYEEKTKEQGTFIENHQESTHEEAFIDNYDQYSVSDNDEKQNDQYSVSDNGEKQNDQINMSTLHQFTNTSVLTFCEELTSIFRRANVNKSHSSSFMKLIKSVLPVPNNMPSSMEELLSQLGVKNLFTRRRVCLLCKKDLEFGQNLCSSCPSSDFRTMATVFDVDILLLTTEIVNRLKDEIKHYKQQINEHNDHAQTRDIPFCKLYQELLEMTSGQDILSLLLHLDGISLTNSSQLKLWLFSGSIIELPPKLRYRRYNMIPMSIWIGYVEPDPTIWLKNVSNQILNLKRQSIPFGDSSLKLKIYGVTGDCPALKIVLNFIGHNGYSCCWLCYIYGQHIEGKRQYHYHRPINMRSRQGFLLESNEAHQTQTRINGHLGKSVLQNLLDIPLPDAIVIDYMHVTLLGHVKAVVVDLYRKLLPIHRSSLNHRLKNQLFPHFFSRKVRSFTDFANIKAVELKNLFFYCLLPNLHDHLPLEQTAHFALYLCSVRLFHGKPLLGEKTGKVADDLFCAFYKDHGQFHHQLQNFVLHLHAHFKTMYINHSSLANIGCFSQEDLIGSLSQNHHGSRYYGELIVYYFNIDFWLHNKQQTKKTIDGPVDPSGLLATQHEDAAEFHALLCSDCSDTDKCLTIYRRFIIDQRMYHSLIYNRRQQSISYFVGYQIPNDSDHQRFGTIKYFFSYQGQGYAVIHRHLVKNPYSDYYKASKYYHLLKDPLNCLFFVLEKNSRRTDLVQTDSIINHCIVVHLDDVLVVTSVSNYNEHD